jgi:hypothetical protein
MKRGRVALIVVALILAVSAFLLRITGVGSGDEWWEIVVPGVVAATMVYLLIVEVRGKADV